MNMNLNYEKKKFLMEMMSIKLENGSGDQIGSNM